MKMTTKDNIFKIIALLVCVASIFTGVFYFTKYRNAMSGLHDANFAVTLMQEELDANNAEMVNIQDELSNVRHELLSTDQELIATKNALSGEQATILELNEVISNYDADLQAANAIIDDLKSNEYKFVYIGDYKLTHYCTEKYAHICGTGNGLTATGTNVTTGRTIAVDPSVIPYGAMVYIEGYGMRIAEDCGGSVDGKHIDIAVDTHSEALALGTKYNMGVWILVEN